MKYKAIIIILIVLLLAFGGVLAIYKVRSGESAVTTGNRGQTEKEPETTLTAAEPADKPDSDQKSDNSGNVESVTSSSQSSAPLGPPPADVSGLGFLQSSVTAQHSVSDDSIGIMFYVQGPSSFTLQEKVSDSWKTAGEGIYYTGSGGLPAGALAPGENSKTLRLLKIENGQYVSASREYTVLRSDVIAAGGIKTYRN